jgi:hypothetical protein
MKLVILDIDGVLNSRRYMLQVGDKWDDPAYQMDPLAVARLNRITDATGASIVISSTWRLAFTHYLDKLQACMASYNITAPVIGMTPDMVVQQSDSGLYLAHGTRFDEIRSWLAYNQPIDSFVILDDETLDGLSDHHIQTQFDDGLLDVHVDRAIAILNTK